MANKIIEVTIKNKKHLECCDALIKTMGELEDTQLSLIDAKNKVTDMKQRHSIESDLDTDLDKKIKEIDEKHTKLKERAEISGCFRDDVEVYAKKKCDVKL